MTKHTSSKKKIEEAIRLLDKLQDDREGFPTDWTGIRIAEIKKILDMPVCEKCKNKVPKVYNCEHTNDQDYCSDCYTELHYYLTE